MTDARHGAGPYRTGIELHHVRVSWLRWPHWLVRLECAIVGHYWFRLRAADGLGHGRWCYRCNREEWRDR